MKKLKLDHELATLVVKGEKWSTWRLFDDKDLSVNDDVELIDKIDPKKPETWRLIGVARINKIIEKRFADIGETDIEGHEKFASIEEMLQTYQKYYGSNVTLATPIKILCFGFTPIGAKGTVIEHEQSRVEAVKIYADGGSRGNPGPSSSGYVIMDMDDKVLVDKGIYLGVTTNNQAEYQALKFALEEAQKMHPRKVDVYTDSLLVINQMKGIFKVKNRDLWPIHDAIKQLVGTFEHVSFTQVPRELNKLADAAVNRALDEELEP
ncbi:MAG TPA: reverse transcriptase-like protein [Candidatus Saccharimonadales bacterium]|jgi:ribonuclease HI